MVSKIFSTSAMLLLAAKLAAAQTSSACNPIKGDTCPDNPALPESVTIDFTQGASDYFDVADGTTLEYDETNGAIFTISKETDAPTISSNLYMFFGSIEVVMQAAPGTGIVTSVVLESNDLDEVDWEWVGGDTIEAQTNYFGKGNTTTYDRGGFSKVSSPQTEFHTYGVDWSPESIVWTIDGVATRTLTYSAAQNGAAFPQTPMQIKLGTWVGGSSTASEGTVTWAGGLTPFGDGDGPYKAYYKSIKIINNSNGVSGATSYTYVGTTGAYEDIRVNTDGNSTSSSTSSSSSASASGTSTKSSSKSSSTASADSSSASADSSSSSDSSSAAGSSTASSGNATGTAAATTTGSSAKTTSTMATATKSSSSSSTASGTSSSASSSSTAATSGVGKLSTSLFGAAAGLLVALSVL